MNRLNNAFTQPTFVAYLTAGDRSFDFTVEAALALVRGGVDLLEIGVPFSDPVADGPVIQHAMFKALQNNVTLTQTCNMIQSIRAQTDVPIILFTYYNPLLQAGALCYAHAANAGVDGILLVDCPFEEAKQHQTHCEQHGLAPIAVLSNTTSTERLKIINQAAKGFLYYACRNGTTGVQQHLPEQFPTEVKRIKEHTSLPVVAGFGIGSRHSAQTALQYADGFVVGSYFVKAINDGATASQLELIAKNIDPRRPL